MNHSDLRTFLQEVDKIGELTTLHGADLKLEIGSITLCSQEEEQAPAILFDDIKDFPPGYRIIVNCVRSLNRTALALDLPLGLKPIELVKAWREKYRSFKPIPPVLVKYGPVLENVQEENEVNILKFPAPFWNQDDGGRYIGTGSVDITRDPDEGWVNLGTYRLMVHDEKTLGFFIVPGKNGWIHRDKYFASGQPCKVAISLGHEPLVFVAGTSTFDYGFCEYDFIGGVKKSPVEVIAGPYTGLPVPATSEIVLEGISFPGDTRTEGPFGEWTGYYGSGRRPEPVIHVKRVMHRHNPIIFGEPPGRSLWGTRQNYKSIMDAAMIWDQIEKAGISDIKGVYFPPGGGRLILIVSLKQRYPGHAKQAGLVASGCQAAAYMGRYVIVVDEDIDPADYFQVTWALATRSDPAKSIDIIRRHWGSPVDPIAAPGEKGHNSRAIIEACKPYEWINEFPRSVTVDPFWREKYQKDWKEKIFKK